MIDIKKLRYFVAVAEEGHFGRAATRLGISQPPLSDHIQQLERLLQTELLHRTTRRVSLTQEGTALLLHARKILVDIDQCAQVIQQSHSQQKQVLRLGILHAHTYTFLPNLLRYYLQAQPGIRIELLEYTTREQVDTLLGDQVDVGLIREPVNHPALKTVRLFTEQYALAAPAEWRLARSTPISVSSIHKKLLSGIQAMMTSAVHAACFGIICNGIRSSPRTLSRSEPCMPLWRLSQPVWAAHLFPSLRPRCNFPGSNITASKKYRHACP